jgi:ATP-binding cassette subfamily B multidrug efflux pump
MIKAKTTDWQTIKRIFELTKPFKQKFILTLCLGILLAIVSPIRPILIQKTIDDDIMRQDGLGLKVMSLLIFINIFLEFVIKYIFSLQSTILGQSIMKYLRTKLFNHVANLNLSFFDKTPVGIITTRTINDIEAVNNIFSEGFITILTDILTLLFVIICMLFLNWKLTLVCLTTFPLMLWATYIFKEKVRVSFHTVREKVAQLNAFVQEHISGMRIIQIFNAQENEFRKFEKINYEHYKANDKSVLYFSIFFPFVEVVLSLAIALLIWYGSKLVLNEEASLGIFAAFIMYLNMAFRPLRMLADKFNTLQMGIIAAERVFKLLDNQEKIDDNGRIVKARFDGDIEFRNVSFAYKEDNFVLNNLSFSIQAGQTLALVGATGSGKSSITNLLNRFYDINSGSILIDNIDIKEYSLDSLRAAFAYVLQDVFLFSGSILDNITLNNKNISRETVVDAAKLVGAHTFIMELPKNYDYEVQERGATLSVGQRQLLSFIRALVYNPSILILDEATSSIDTESEILIQQAIQKLVKDRTAIIVAHRLSTIQHADKILVLEKGKLIEIGNHQTLIQKENGYYKKLYDMQFNSNHTPNFINA